MMDNNNITIRYVKPDEKEEVRAFLRKFFYNDEPCNQYLKVITEESPICEDLETFSLADLESGLSIAAEYNGKIVGVCINGLVKRGEPAAKISITDNKFIKIANMLNYIEEEAALFEKYPDVDKILNVFILSVDATVRGKGIAKQLHNKSKEIAKEQGAQLLSMECTSFYSAAVAKSTGSELVYSLAYKDYKVNGEVVFKPEAPHEHVQMFVTRI